MGIAELCWLSFELLGITLAFVYGRDYTQDQYPEGELERESVDWKSVEKALGILL